MGVARQLFREFWLPFTAAVLWTAANVIGLTAGVKNPIVTRTITIINTFGPAFFFCSWLTAQYFRVRKQTHVETGLGSIEKKIGGLVSDLETRTEDLIAHLTGGNSFCYLSPLDYTSDNNTFTIAIVHSGKHVLFDVNARIVDIDAFGQITGPMTLATVLSTERRLAFNTFFGATIMWSEVFKLGNGDKRSFNIFWNARNGTFVQLLRFRKIAGQWNFATKIERMNGDVLNVLHSHGEEILPRNPEGGPDWT